MLGLNFVENRLNVSPNTKQCYDHYSVFESGNILRQLPKKLCAQKSAFKQIVFVTVLLILLRNVKFYCYLLVTLLPACVHVVNDVVCVDDTWFCY